MTDKFIAIIKEAQDIINELNVSTAQKAPDGRYLQYVRVFNNGGDKEGAWKKYEKSEALAKKWVKGHSERSSKEISKYIDADGNIKESLEILKEAQDIISNLFEVEYYGANDVEEEQNNKIKRQGKDKHGNKVDLVSVQDELFPYEGNAKEQYNKKIIAKINDMIEGKATLEDLIQLVRNKKTPVKEAQEIIEEEVKKERKNNKQQVFRRIDDPEKNKIGVKKNYNRVIHNDSASKDPAFDYVKIKGTKYQIDKYGQIGAPVKEGFEGAIDLLEAIINERVTVAKWVEAAKRAENERAEKASKELMKNIFGKENNDKEAHNAVHRAAHAKAVSKLTPSDDNAQDVREIHRAAIEPLRKKVDRATKAGRDKRKDVERLEKAQEIAGVRPDSSKYVS